jgi:hypothetical protein
MQTKNMVAASGFAMMPEGNAAHEIFKTIGCTLLIDKEKKVIVDASFTFVMPLTNEFLSSMIRGVSIEEGIQPVLHQVKEHFLSPGQSAIQQAIRAAYERFLDSHYP